MRFQSEISNSLFPHLITNVKRFREINAVGFLRIIVLFFVMHLSILILLFFSYSIVDL